MPMAGSQMHGGGSAGKAGHAIPARLQAALDNTAWAFEVGELDETAVVAYRVEGVGW